MDNIPQRRTVALPYRSLLAFLEKRVYLPNITPSYYHVFGLVASVLFLLRPFDVGEGAGVGLDPAGRLGRRGNGAAL